MSTSESTSSNAPTAGRDNDHPFRYTAALAESIESRWQQRWEEENAFHTPNPGDAAFDGSKPKFFCLDMFPYPSGAGLHVGHPEGYTATDIICRYKRMKGFNVLHPMGWDAFGLPAEQYAIATGVHPAITTRKAIDNFRRQLKRFGFSYDWSREFATIDPDYYKWTQWIWAQAYESWFDAAEQKARPISELIDEFRSGTRVIRYDPDCPRGITLSDDAETVFDNWDELDRSTQRQILSTYRLAYLAEQTVNWCPKLGTALANEEVIDGRSERGDFPVFRKPLRQWMFRITAYADRLLADLEGLAWPESTQTMQEQWIGRSEGAEVDFPLADGGASIRVFTTRPDTIFGATFMVIAPEHPIVDDALANPSSEMNLDDVRTYVEESRNRSDVERMADSDEKTGKFLGIYATNPATGERIPIWVADYVLMGYGHGAIMAVPAHDDRDFEFAQTFDLQIRDVVYTPVFRRVRAFAETIERHNVDPSTLSIDHLVDFISLSMNQKGIDDDTTWKSLTRRGDEIFDKGATRAEGERRGTIAHIWRDALKDFVHDDLAEMLSDAMNGRLLERLGAAAPEPGVAVNSANDSVSLNGLHTNEAKSRIIEWMEDQGIGNRKINFKLRDWLFSRQRYWGEPFPIVYDEDGNHYAVTADHLPVELPEMADYKPVESDDPAPLLAKATDWMNTTAGDAGVDADELPSDTKVVREANTMPGWAGSCWYYLRFCDASNKDALSSAEAERYWMLSRRDGSNVDGDESFDASVHHRGGVDLYIGGAEHAVLHLLYARFWHKILFDLGHVSTPEPFGKLFHQGLITSFAFVNDEKRLVPVDEVEERGEDEFFEIETGKPVTRTTAKMSKSLKNVINPDDVIADYGADTFRLYEMYMGPLDASKPWNTRDIVGPFRFLQRCWRLFVNEEDGSTILNDGEPNADLEKELHRAIERAGTDIERLQFNTAIAALIEFVNAATGSALTKDQAIRFATILSPFAPHMAEALGDRFGMDGTIAAQAWPEYDESLLVEDEIELAVQVLGKVRSKITVAADADNDTVEKAALADERIAELIEGKTVRKVIVVPGKLVNIVAN